MEILRKYLCLSLILLSTYCFGSDKGFSSIKDAIKDPKATKFIDLRADSASLELLRDHVKSFAHLRGLALQGRVENTEALWTILSELQLLEYLFFLDNDLKELKIGGTTSTLKYLWIKNSPSLDAQSLNAFLNRSNLINSLRLDQVNLGMPPKALKNMPILKELQISGADIKFKELMAVLIKYSSIQRLNISDNNFQLIDKGLKKLRNLKYLDISGNNLSGSMAHMKHLRQLDTLIANRNAFNNLNPVARKIQLTGAHFIALDNRSEKIRNEVEYLLPGQEVIWNSKKYFSKKMELPSFESTDKKIEEAEVEKTKTKNRISEYAAVTNEVKLLSEAYLTYDRLVFPNPLRNFDTTRFTARHLDSSYVFVEKINMQNHTLEGEKHKLKFSRKYGGIKKKKKTVKIDHYKDSHVIFDFYTEKESDVGHVITIDFNHVEGQKRRDMNGFRQYVWLITMDKEMFRREFIEQKAWSDIRLEFEKGIFRIKLKGRFEDAEFEAELRYKRNPNEMRKLEKSASTAFAKYQGGYSKEEVRFNKSLKSKKKKVLRPYAKELSKLWAIVESDMSEEEKEMSHKEWLEYYRELKKVEYSLLPSTPFNLAYLSRYMVSQGFREKRSNDFYVGQRWVDASIIYQNDTLELDRLCIIDLDQKMVSKVNVKRNAVLLEPFHDFIIYGVSKQQQYFSLGKEEVEQLLNKSAVEVKELKSKEELPNVAVFYKERIFPILSY